MAVYLSVLLNFFIYLLLFKPSYSYYINEKEALSKVEYLRPNEQFKEENGTDLSVLCYNSVPKSFFQIWRTVNLRLEHAPMSYELFTGENASDVILKANEKSMWDPSSWLTGVKTSIDFPAFSHYCIGISTKETYAIYLQVRVINYWKVLQALIGILLYLSAPTLSRNAFFHYTSGVSLGVVASLLIVIFIVSKFIPKKSASYAVMFFGYSIILYGLQVFWQQFNVIVSTHLDILLIYCLCAAFISFIVCYRLGPVQNVRTFNIIQWFLQAIAVMLIYLSSEYREVSTALIILLMTMRIIPASWLSRFQLLWYRLFPPKIKLLTELEYIEQGNIETRKALEDLRKFCRSPDCNTWKVVRQLKDPMRFSKFIDTGSHYTDEELLRYNSESFDDDDEDDKETETEISNSSNGSAATPLNYFKRR